MKSSKLQIARLSFLGHFYDRSLKKTTEFYSLTYVSPMREAVTATSFELEWSLRKVVVHIDKIKLGLRNHQTLYHLLTGSGNMKYVDIDYDRNKTYIGVARLTDELQVLFATGNDTELNPLTLSKELKATFAGTNHPFFVIYFNDLKAEESRHYVKNFNATLVTYDEASRKLGILHIHKEVEQFTTLYSSFSLDQLFSCQRPFTDPDLELKVESPE